MVHRMIVGGLCGEIEMGLGEMGLIRVASGTWGIPRLKTLSIIAGLSKSRQKLLIASSSVTSHI